MSLTCPPLPISCKHEKKTFNDFHGTHPVANDASRKKLAKLFPEKSSYTTFFLKLPSMIKSHESKWEKSCLIKLAATQMKDEYELLLSHLTVPVDHAQDKNVDNDNMTVASSIREESAHESQATFPAMNHDDDVVADNAETNVFQPCHPARN